MSTAIKCYNATGVCRHRDSWGYCMSSVNCIYQSIDTTKASIDLELVPTPRTDELILEKLKEIEILLQKILAELRGEVSVSKMSVMWE